MGVPPGSSWPCCDFFLVCFGARLSLLGLGLRPANDMDSPADKALAFLDRFLQGEEVGYDGMLG